MIEKDPFILFSFSGGKITVVDEVEDVEKYESAVRYLFQRMGVILQPNQVHVLRERIAEIRALRDAARE